MENKELNHKIKQAFSHAVPDVLDSVLSQCDTQKGNVIMIANTKKTNLWVKRLAGIAAVFLLFIGGTFGFQAYQVNYTVDSTVSLDVNPSIEIQVNQKEKVLAVNSLNEDGRIVIGDMDFTGSNLDLTLNALIGSMLRNGYLTDLANSILISVDNEDPAKGADLQAKLTEEINAMLQTNTFNGAVLSQTISPSSELQQLADTYGITLGKAQLIQQIINQNSFYSFEDLVPLSINELNLLSESGNMNLDNISSVGTASDKAYIGDENARSAALSHAGLTSDDISYYEIELDYEQGTMIYEIEFKCNGYEYEYDIDAVTGAVLASQKKQDNDYTPPQNDEITETPGDTNIPDNSDSSNTTDNTNTPPSEPEVPIWHHNGHHNEPHHSGNYSYIGEDAAKSIAFSHACVSEGNLHHYECDLDDEDGTMVYEIDFTCDGYEYSYDINALTGEVIKHDKEWDD